MADTGARKLDFDPTPAPLPTVASMMDELGVTRLIQMLRRRLWVIVLTTMVVFFMVAFATITATRMYSATAQVQIEQRQNQILGGDVTAVLGGLPRETAAIDTETEILSSRALAGRVVDSLNLVSDPEFNPPESPGLMSSVRTAIFGARAEAASDAAAERSIAREAAITALLENVTIERVGLTYIINITVTSEDPGKAKRLADSFAELYLTQQLERKYDTIARANEWLSNRLEALREEVRAKERAVEEYRIQSGNVIAGDTRLNEQQIAQLSLELVTSRAALAEREARLRGVEQQIAAGGAADTAGEALSSMTITNLREQQALIARQRAELSTRYGPKHPEMERIRRESEDIDGRIRDEVNRIIASLRNEVQIARNRVFSIEASLGTTQSSLAQSNVGAVKLRELERDAEASKTLYEAFLNRFKEVAEQSGIEQPDATIPARATTPLEPSSPNTRLNLILGLVLGGLLGCAVAVLIELLEQSLRTQQDVHERLGAICLGALPHLDRKTRVVDGELVSAENFVLKRPLSAFGEALRSVRASVFFANPDRKVKVVAISSALPEEGKTTTSIGLARISALAGSRTVLVDCDLRRRSATHALGFEVEKGLTEVLFRTAELDSVIQKDPGSGCDVVPLAQAEFTARDLFGSDAMRQLLEQLRQRYDVIVLDTAPVLPLSDTRVLSALADSVVVVARWGKTPASVVRHAMEQIRSHGGRIAGVVLQGVATGTFARLLYDAPDQYTELYQTYYVR